MDGSATFTTVMSRITMNSATQSRTRTAQGWRAGAPSGPGTGVRDRAEG